MRKSAEVMLSTQGHDIARDRFNHIVRHPANGKCKGVWTAGRIETYFTQKENVLWELEKCCGLKLSQEEKEKVLA